MKNMSPRLASEGFSLIELMIVLVIMSFVLALAGPAVTPYFKPAAHLTLPYSNFPLIR
jgi:prepilin-type N-terminal cleavage/methylation domain-containing protein